MGVIKLESSKKAEAVRNNLDLNTEESLSSTLAQRDHHIKKKNTGTCRQILLLFTGILIIFSLFVGILFAIECLHPASKKSPNPVSRVVNDTVLNVGGNKSDSNILQNERLVGEGGSFNLNEFFSNVLLMIKDLLKSHNDSSVSEEKVMIETNIIQRSGQSQPIHKSMGDYFGEEELIEEINEDNESDPVRKSKIMTFMSQENEDFKHIH